jgi:hypothetical protein
MILNILELIEIELVNPTIYASIDTIDAKKIKNAP